ncbi:MAG: hypothetical protein AAF311_04120 [Pseudomonadota bacterium]
MTQIRLRPSTSLLIILAGLLILALPSAVRAQTSSFLSAQQDYQQICEGLNRSHIDCACVGRRIATYQHIAPTEAYKDYIRMQYRETLGQVVDLAPVAEAAMGSDEAVMDLVAAYDPHGGEGIYYEQGCVIEGAPLTPLPERPTGDPYDADYRGCAETSGERFCQCTIALRSRLMTRQEYKASFLAVTDYSGRDGSRDGLNRMRAQKMGLSVDAYVAAVRRANEKMDATRGTDGMLASTARCAALTYGESVETRALSDVSTRTAAERAGPAEGLETIDVTRPAPRPQTGEEMIAEFRSDQQAAGDEARRNAVGIDAELEAIRNDPDVAQIMSADGIPPAADVLAQGCAGEDGRSPAYCQCLSREFAGAVPAGTSDSVKRMTATMLVGSGLPPALAAQISNQTPDTDRRQAALMLSDVMDIPERCESASAQSAMDEALSRTSGLSTRERYSAVCKLEHDEMSETICDCATDHFDKNLNDSEWSMLIDIQVAQMKGEDRAFETYAENLGMSEEEAARAMMSNPRIMQTMMGLAPACMSFGFGQ